ncbi:MAG: hypothetical protein QM610_07660 [Chitinophagaceae bacterium]
MLDVITKYNTLKSHLPMLLDMSGYRLDFVAESLGFSKAYFYNKKSKNKFSNEEFEKIVNFIWRDEMEDKLLEMSMQESEKTERVGEAATKALIDKLIA